MLAFLAAPHAITATARSPWTTGAPVRAETNDNRQTSGVLRDGVLTIHLVA